MRVLPGVLLALILALAGSYCSVLIGTHLMGLSKSPVSPILLAIILGILVRNTVGLAPIFNEGVRFSLVRILRLGIVLMGIRLGLGQVGDIGLKALPVIIACIAVALVLVTAISRKLGLTARLGTLIAAGTGICGATAIVALAPTIKARDDETAYAVACITLFGVMAMLAYPFLAHWVFAGDELRAGLFLGTSIHETAQVAGAGLVYQQYFGSAQALDVATVTKLVRNLGMLVVIPLLSLVYHQNEKESADRPSLWSMIPLFVVGFGLMSLIRTVGDMGNPAFGFIEVDKWQAFVAYTRHAAELLLGVAMAAVGLGTSLASLKQLGLKPMMVGLFSALLVGVVAYSVIVIFY